MPIFIAARGDTKRIKIKTCGKTAAIKLTIFPLSKQWYNIFMKLIKYLERQSSKPLVIKSAFVLVFLIGGVDYLTGEELSISIFYLLPITLVVWFANMGAGIFISVVSTAVWHMAAFMISHKYSNTLISYWNSIVQLGFFLAIVFILSALKKEYEKGRVLLPS